MTEQVTFRKVGDHVEKVVDLEIVELLGLKDEAIAKYEKLIAETEVQIAKGLAIANTHEDTKAIQEAQKAAIVAL